MNRNSLYTAGALLALSLLAGCAKPENECMPSEMEVSETVSGEISSESSGEISDASRGETLVRKALSLLEEPDGDLLPTPNWTEAIPLFRQAAEMQNGVAERYLGYVYATGSGISKDLTEAEKWYRTAAEHGDVKAQFNLALFCLTGADGETEPNISEAEAWFRAAAAQGHPDAQRFLTEILPQYQDRLPDALLPGVTPYSGNGDTAPAVAEPLPDELPSDFP